MKANAILWLRFSFWAGAVLDLLAGLTMLFPALFAINNQLSSFYPTPAYRYAIGMGAPLMLAWTVLLLWAARKPLERKGLLPITLLVVLGEVLNEIVAARTGYISARALLPTWIAQATPLDVIYFQLPERQDRTGTMTALIEASHLRKTFGATVAVDDLSLHLDAGEIYGLVGSDGAGKTTAIRLLVAALKLDSGSASVCGFPLDKQAEQARARLGYLSQRFSLYEDLSVLENIRFFAELRGLTQKEWLPRSLEILDFVGLSAFKHRRAGQLSGGMKQKLGLASALVTQPALLLLDEPTTGVDPVTRQDFWQLLIRIVSAPLSDASPLSGGTGGSPRGVLLTTPYMDEASRCHRVGFLRQGRLIAEGTPSELRSTLSGRILELHGESLPSLREFARKIEGVEDIRLFGNRLHLRIAAGRTDSVLSALKKILSSARGLHGEARTIPPTLEDVFIAFSTGQE